MNTQFVDLHAAADFMGPGAIEVDRYQTEIFDIVQRRGAFGQRIKNVPATGHPSRFFEETAIPAPTAANGFVDPRNIVATVNSPTRVERSVPLKALVSQINYNLFDIEVGSQQEQFAYLQAKDLADSVTGVMRTHDVALWNGNDTSLSAPTTLQYFGAAAQISGGGNVATVPTTESIVDGLKSQIAAMVSNSNYEVRPTAIYANPVLLDLIDREMKSEFNVVLSTTKVEGGLTVKTLSTQAGESAADSGMGAAVHGHSGQRLGGASRLHRDRRPDRVSLADRCQSSRLPAWTDRYAGSSVDGGEVRRSCGEGRRICTCPGDREPLIRNELRGRVRAGELESRRVGRAEALPEAREKSARWHTCQRMNTRCSGWRRRLRTAW